MGLTGLSGGMRVVVADDEANEQLLLAAASVELGAEVSFEFVDNGLELLELLERRQADDALPDIVVLDLRMPTMSGHQTLLALARHPELWSVPVVVWTTSDQADEPDRCLTEGALWFERKPAGFGGYLDFVRSLEDRVGQLNRVGGDSADWDSILEQILASEGSED